MSEDYVVWGGYWYFEVETDKYGVSEFGGYDTEEKANASLRELLEEKPKRKELAYRFRSGPYQGSRRKGFKGTA